MLPESGGWAELDPGLLGRRLVGCRHPWPLGKEKGVLGGNQRQEVGTEEGF